MKGLFWLCLVGVGLMCALFNFKGLAIQGEFESIVLDFREDVPATLVQTQINAITQQYKVQPQLNSAFSTVDHIYIVKGNRRLLNQLKHSQLAQATEFIEPNYLYYLPPGDAVVASVSGKNTQETINPSFRGPNDPYYNKQWNLHKLGVEAAWEETKGSGVTVAVIDTGISRVPDLQLTNIVKGYDFVNDKENVEDDNGHGTHVAGTIAQSTNNSYGVAGIAYEASLMPLKVLSATGGGSVADIAEAVKYAAEHGADVINMSLGGGGESQLLQQAIDYAYRKNVVVVAAAGNANQNSTSYPARYPHVIGVSAFDPAGEKASYSNFGAGVDISAPGGSAAGGILQETIQPETGETQFAAFQGTSMAAPHVAAVAALVKAVGIKQPDVVLEVIKQSARAIPDDTFNYFGAGQLNAADAVKIAAAGQISFRDFFRWLRDNGYLSPRFWIDGGVVMLLPKLAMIVGSYLLAWFLRVYFPFRWNWSLAGGLIAGSSGLFLLRGVYIFDLPQWPFRLVSSSIPELGNAIGGSSALNPLFASVLIPLVLLAFLLGYSSWKWFAIGITVGVASCLAVSAVVKPDIWWLGQGMLARSYLIINALMCYGLAWLAMPREEMA